MVIPNEYPMPGGATPGAIGHEDGWDRTDFIPLANVYSMTVSATQASGYNCYYKADKTFRVQIAVTTTPTTIYPPSDAAYAIFSFSRNVMAEFKPTYVTKTDHQIAVNKALALSGTGSVFSSTSQLVAPYDDCDTFPNNSTVTILANPVGTVAHIPAGFSGGTVITVDAQANGTIEAAQIAVGKDGQIYARHNYSGWTDWVAYAHTGLALEGSAKIFSTAADLTAPYDDCDTFPNNTTVTIIANAASLVDNLPSDFAQGTIVTLDATANDTIAKAQIAIRKNGTISSRHKWGDEWSEWVTPTTAEETIYTEFSMFPSFAVLGDSFASGTILTQQGSIWGMYPDYAWPNMLARMTGCSVGNYSHSGLSTRTWLTDSDGLAKMLADTPKALYLMCLGINDGAIYNEDSSYLGSVADMKSDYTQNPDTFYGNYGRIIGNIKAHAPNARIILIANPTYDTTSATWQLFQSAMAEIAQTAGIPFIAGHADSYFDSSFYQNGKAVEHPIAMTYSGMAKAYKRQVELAIQNNTEYFWNVH
jgi:hypothetical protein